MTGSASDSADLTCRALMLRQPPGMCRRRALDGGQRVLQALLGRHVAARKPGRAQNCSAALWGRSLVCCLLQLARDKGQAQRPQCMAERPLAPLCQAAGPRT